jgi:hypothetical protein
LEKKEDEEARCIKEDFERRRRAARNGEKARSEEASFVEEMTRRCGIPHA